MLTYLHTDNFIRFNYESDQANMKYIPLRVIYPISSREAISMCRAGFSFLFFPSA